MAAGGFKMSLGGLKAKPGLKAAASKGASKPKKALLGDDEPEDTNTAQEIAGFDAASGGAISAHAPAEKKGPLVIPSLPNRNWREEARKKQLERAPHTQQAHNGDVVMEEPEKEVVYGLSVPLKPTDGGQNGTTGEEEEAPRAMDVVDPQEDGLTAAQRLDAQALASLLTGKATDTARVVPALTDSEALQNDLASAPDEPSLDAYEATPIEGFGLAMLRGMGWKDGDGENRKGANKAPAEVKRRPALLGIGAKEDAGKDVELGEFNSKARPKKGMRGKGEVAQGYNPVSLRNKRTGEVITEEELKRKMEAQELVGEEEEGGRNEGRGGRDSGRDDKSERRRDRDRRDDRDHRSRRDRDEDAYDSSRRRDKRSRDDEYDSERRRREKRRQRSRSPREEEKKRSRYRSRSRSRDGKKDRRERRDMDRSRDRDRDRDRDDEERRRRRRREKEREAGKGI